MEQLRRSAEAANIYLTALLVTVGVFFVGGSIWVVIPGQGRWWLATVYIGVLAAVLVMRGRAFASREQSIIVVATGLLMVLITAANYACRREHIHCLHRGGSGARPRCGRLDRRSGRAREGVLTCLPQGHRMDRVPADRGRPPDGDLAAEPDLPREEHVMIGQRAGVLATVAVLAAAWATGWRPVGNSDHTAGC